MNNIVYQNGVRKLSLTLFICFLSIGSLFSQNPTTLRGVVYHDKNHNGLFDKEEQGVAGVGISDRHGVVETNTEGQFIMTLHPNSEFVYMIKPAGYSLPHAQSFYYRVEDLDVQMSLAIPLYTNKSEQNHKVLLIGDPQVADRERLDYFVSSCVEKMYREEPDFSILLGDIADDNLNILSGMKTIFSTSATQTYFVPGNHDRDLDSTEKSTHFATFKSLFGPDYYSFNYGNAHYIVLNNIDYEGYNNEQKKPGNYFGGLDQHQLNWLKNDLALIDEDCLLVVLSHIPFLEQYCNKESIDSLFSMVCHHKHIVSLSGHLHTTKAWNYGEATRWKVPIHHEGLVVNAACGSWWTEPKDEFGIPVATCMDGSPRGYFVFDVSQNNYRYRLTPFGEPNDYQIRVTTLGKNDSISITANWFVGKPTDRVTVRINDGKELTMTNYCGVDPFIEATIDRRRNRDNWIPSLQETNHLWKNTVALNPQDPVQKIEVIAYQNDKPVSNAVKLLLCNTPEYTKIETY